MVLITIDTLRADHLSIYGYRRDETPGLDRVGREGVVFDSAYCDVTWTSASMASTFTGTLPARHGVRSTYHRFSASNLALAERLQESGYATGAVIGSFPVSDFYGFDQGFEVFDQEFTTSMTDSPTGAGSRSDAEVTDAAIALYRKLLDRGAPVFLFVHYFGPHGIQQTHADAWVDHIKEYPDQVLVTDREIGRLLDGLPFRDGGQNTLVVLHADHGEGLKPGARYGHAKHLYQSTLKVPLLLRWPARLAAGRRVDVLVGNVDITPTILDAAGIPFAADSLDGRSLFDALDSPSEWRELHYAETFVSAQQLFSEQVTLPNGRSVPAGVRRFGLVGARWKYIVTEPFPLLDAEQEDIPAELLARLNREELYDIQADPTESKDLADKRPEILEEMRRKLEDFETGASRSLRSERLELSEEHLDRLRTLGYVE